MQKHKVSHLVRVCDASYDAARVGKEGIEVKDWPFVDGDAPPDAIITQWLELVTRMSEGKGVRYCIIHPFNLFPLVVFALEATPWSRQPSGHRHSYSLRRRSRPRSGISGYRTC